MSDFFSKYAVLLIVLFLIRVILSIVIASFAKKKGKSFALFFVLTLLFSAVVGILVLLISVSMNNNRVEYEPKSTSADEIRKYKMLLDSGAITQEEYEEKKKQLLGM